MYTWNGVTVGLTNQIEVIVAKAKEKKTRIWIIAAVFALGLIIFLRGK